LRLDKFDLTTRAGILSAAKEIGKSDWPLLLLPTVGPIAYFGKKAFDAIGSAVESADSMLEMQREAAIEIAKAGKDAGAECIEITLDQDIGMKFGSQIEGFPIQAKVGKSGHMTIKVVYK